MIRKFDNGGHSGRNFALVVEDIKQEEPMGIDVSGAWRGAAGLV